jgi:NIMA (never in mitosis gene a)-related kinase
MAYSELYSELKVVGRGNFGRTYSGTVHLVQSNRDHQKYVAKKIMLVGMSPDQLKATFREVAVLEKLKHPHIVRYIESFTQDDHLIIVMEHCDSGDLSKRVTTARDKGEPLTEALILHWLLQCALALEFMHANKVLHRDIKCSNILLTRENTVKLGDFGISRVLEHTNSVALTMVGTPYYMSPEVCESQPYNAKSDVWSLGCLAYELCFLNYPFTSANLLGLIVKISKEEPAGLPEHYSIELRRLIG